MRGKTRNLLENIIAFAIFLTILYGIYYLIAKYTGLEKIFSLDEVEQFVEKYVDKNDTRVQSKFIIKDDITDKNETNSSIKKEETPITTQDLTVKKLEKKAETKVIVKDKPIKEKEQTSIKQNEKPKIEKESTVKVDKEVTKPVEKKVILEKQTQEDKEISEDTTSSQEQNETKESEKPTKKVILSAENLEMFSIINKFIRTTKQKIHNSIEQYGIEYESDSDIEVSIRITVLKDGGYEHLVLSNGNREYFDLITPAILDVFPIEIDERIEDQFPRYFRMTITKEN